MTFFQYYSTSHVAQPQDKLDYGVKGQRWGVRRNRRKSDSISKLSDKQLQDKVRRLQLEQNHRQLLKKQRESSKSDLRKGAERIGKMVAVAATTTVTAYAGKKVGKAVIQGVEKAAPAAKKKARDYAVNAIAGVAAKSLQKQRVIKANQFAGAG